MQNDLRLSFVPVLWQSLVIRTETASLVIRVEILLEIGQEIADRTQHYRNSGGNSARKSQW